MIDIIPVLALLRRLLLLFTSSHIEFVKASIGPFWQELLTVFEGDNWPFGHTYRTCIVSSIKTVVERYSEKSQKRYLLQYTKVLYVS